ncbi:helix-turn-helix transcriptional regulator [Sorangium sp. So ce1335]|uniref:helix-turn-helix domain-containing protein n=1 Tax=Sorangium sp. So ce1335 TaxID=3133335 RepID=UPI003F643ADA
MRGRSAVPFVASSSSEPVDALASARILVSSADLGWPGVHVEVGYNPSWDVRDLAVRAHYLALNTDPHALTFEARVDGRPREITLAPGQLWFCPAGDSFTHRVRAPSGFAIVTLEPEKVLRALGEDEARELRRAYAVDCPQLEHLVRALAAEAERGGPCGATFVDALATALAVQVVGTFGVKAAPASAARGGGLSRGALQRVLALVDAELGEGLTVERMAGVAGLSAAHFARAFRRSLGVAPHQYVLRRRLERARQALEARDADILNVARRLGFSDQAPLTRLFKREFGVTPGHYMRDRAR